EGRYRCPSCGPVAPTPRPLAQLQARDWELRCPTCRVVTTPAPCDEDKPIAPTSVYAVTKRDQEELCLCVGRAYGIGTVALRLFNVYGPRQALSNPYTGVGAIFSSRLLNGQRPPVFEDGRQSRDFIHVSDIVEAFCLALEREDVADVALNVGTGHSTSVAALAEAIARSMGAALVPALRDHVALETVVLRPNRLNPLALAADARRLSAADVAHVQHTYSFFGVDPLTYTLAWRFLRTAIRAPLVVTAHTVRPVGPARYEGGLGSALANAVGAPAWHDVETFRRAEAVIVHSPLQRDRPVA